VLEEVTGHLLTGKAEVGFGGNRVSVALPVRVASGQADATSTSWDGKNVSGAVCGDMHVQQKVSGSVKPASYPVSGGLFLSATARQILASPRFPVVKVKLKVEPSDESWAAVQKILDDKGGVCGFVVDKVNIHCVSRGPRRQGLRRAPATGRSSPWPSRWASPHMTVRGD
jgi:hypothetical protein